MTATEKPLVSRSRTLPLIWIVPAVAVIVGGWLVYREVAERGPEITIDFADGAGVEPTTTVLEYKGVEAGTVSSVTLKKDLSGVVVRLRLSHNGEGLAREGSQFWIVHPEIGFSGVSGLDTLVSGVRLNVRPGTGAPAKQFAGLDHTPPPEAPADGRTFLLKSDRLGSLDNGAPVYYREYKVGEVVTSRLSDDSTSVIVVIHIQQPYVDLVRRNSRFWNAGGLDFKISLLGAELRQTSLESLITGGVEFATPEGELAPAAPSGALFDIDRDPPDKDWLKWAPKIPVESPGSSTAPLSGADMVPSILKR